MHADTSHSEESLRYLRALGDPDRLRIVLALRAGPKSVGEICRELDSPIANVSHHLKTLKDADIVSAEKKGRFVIYRLKHLVETPRPDTHLLDFGCCRVEFGEGRDAVLVGGTPRMDEQALRVLNRILGGSATVAKELLGKPAAPARPAAARARGRQTGRVEVANASFELPATPFFDTAVEGWVKEGDPAGTGVFRNFPDDTPFPGSRRVANADGEQLATIGARNPGGECGPSGLFQSLPGVTYQPGVRYVLSVGVGVSSVQPPTGGRGAVKPPALRVAMTYIDGGGRRRELAGTSVKAAGLAPDRLTRVELAASVPPAVGGRSAARAAAGREAGILLTTAGGSPDHAGNFILDDVQLVAEAPRRTPAPRATPPRPTPRRRGRGSQLGRGRA